MTDYSRLMTDGALEPAHRGRAVAFPAARGDLSQRRKVLLLAGRGAHRSHGYLPLGGALIPHVSCLPPSSVDCVKQPDASVGQRGEARHQARLQTDHACWRHTWEDATRHTATRQSCWPHACAGTRWRTGWHRYDANVTLGFRQRHGRGAGPRLAALRLDCIWLTACMRACGGVCVGGGWWVCRAKSGQVDKRHS
jgi:hypothetical protein